jgi:hypothetical protein
VHKALEANIVSYVPQAEEVDWSFPVSVGDVVMMGRYGAMNFLRIPRAVDRAAVETSLRRVSMWEYRDRQIGVARAPGQLLAQFAHLARPRVCRASGQPLEHLVVSGRGERRGAGPRRGQQQNDQDQGKRVHGGVGDCGGRVRMGDSIVALHLTLRRLSQTGCQPKRGGHVDSVPAPLASPRGRFSPRPLSSPRSNS